MIAPGLFQWFPSLETVTVLPFTEKAAPPELRWYKITPVPLLLLPHPSADNTDNRVISSAPWLVPVLPGISRYYVLYKYIKAKDYRLAMSEQSQVFMER